MAYQIPDHTKEILPVVFGFLYNFGRPVIDQHHGVVVLVVFRHIGAGHQNAGLPRRLQLAEGDGPTAADHQIRSSQAGVHVGDVFGGPNPIHLGQVHLPLLQKLGKELPALLAIAVNVSVQALLIVGHEIRRHAVDNPCPQASAEGQHHQPVVGNAQLFPGFLPGLGNHRFPDGVSHHGKVRLALHPGFGFLHRQQHLIHLFSQHFVGHPGIGVLLMNYGFGAVPYSGQHNSTGDIAPGADDHIRPKIFHNLICPGIGQGQMAQGF